MNEIMNYTTNVANIFSWYGVLAIIGVFLGTILLITVAKETHFIVGILCVILMLGGTATLIVTSLTDMNKSHSNFYTNIENKYPVQVGKNAVNFPLLDENNMIKFNAIYQGQLDNCEFRVLDSSIINQPIFLKNEIVTEYHGKLYCHTNSGMVAVPMKKNV